MKKILLPSAIIVFLTVFLHLGQSSDDPLSVTIRYPSPGKTLSLTGKPFYFTGMLNQENAMLTVNGDTALVDPDGAFVAFGKPLLIETDENSTARFVFEVTSENGEKEESVFEYPVTPMPGKLKINGLAFDLDWEMKPSEDLILKKGETVQIEVRSVPGADVSFSVEGTTVTYPMAEQLEVSHYYFPDALWGEGFEGRKDTVFGVYKGTFRITEELRNASVVVTAVKDGKSIRQRIPGSIGTLNENPPVVVETLEKDSYVTVMTGPSMGYKMYLGSGIRFEVSGREGEWYRVKLTENENAYIYQDNIVELERGTPLPEAEIELIRTVDSLNKTIVEFGFSERVPYVVYQHPEDNSLEVVAYNTVAGVDFIKYVKSYKFIKHIEWRQERDGVLRVRIYLNQKTHWGFGAGYHNNTLRLTIKKPPQRVSNFLGFGSQLEGRRISLDPGHNPGPGASGPRGITETEVNYQICLVLKKLLEDEGAEVYFTRQKDEPLPLRQRKQRVNEIDPEISISIHNNAVPQGVDPLKHNGSSVYYFYPQAKPLAEYIYEAFLGNLRLPDYGLYYDNLYMCRIPESVSLLVEPAFIIIPGQERLLAEEEFQEKIAVSILEGLEHFYEEYAE